MKAYIFTDDLFCWVCVILAESEDEARSIAARDKAYIAGCDLTIKPLITGVLAKGGGNG